MGIFTKKTTQKKYIVGIDEGTTSTRAVLFDVLQNKIVKQQSMKFEQYYPKRTWVEQDANEIFLNTKYCLDHVLEDVVEDEVIAMGLTNQRETVVAFNKETGEPVYKAICWQCKRTAEEIEKMPQNIKSLIREKTGLIPDAYFSATKMKWILENVKEAQELAKNGQLYMGTIDSFLAYKFTGKFVTDTTNASRTMLFNINTLKWDDELLEYFGIDKKWLPKVIDSAHKIGKVDGYKFNLCSIIGDQQASLFGQGCVNAGDTKVTYGTGCFILNNCGSEPKQIDKVLTTVGYTIKGKTKYALEGSVFSGCSTLEWLNKQLGVLPDIHKTNEICESIKGTNGVFLVPAFSGLGAPYWSGTSKGVIVGLTLDSTKDHVIRAGVESMAYNTAAILNQMNNNSNEVKLIKADGGGSNIKFLLQFQADIANLTVVKNKQLEATVLGAIYLAGIINKVYDLKTLENIIERAEEYSPTMQEETRKSLMSCWEKAVRKACSK